MDDGAHQPDRPANAREDAPVAAAKIRIRDLDFYYGKLRALKKVSVDFPANTISAIIGPSGCGKSTLLRTVNGIYELYPGQRASGEILLDGEDVLNRRYSRSRLRKNVGMVFQKPTPFVLSIYENIAFPIRHYEALSRAEMNDRVEEVLSQAVLWDEVKDKLKRSALALSGGQQQRLCIARTLAVRPEVLLLDEPTSALDPISTARIEQLLVELAKRYTILIVTHNLQQAARISQRVAFMLAGELIETDDRERFFVNPRDSRTSDYVTGRFG
ncbi:MAG TPA: phosphate ABC transporter ATP-binding protein PstB [Caulobacteraceae bacterium]